MSDFLISYVNSIFQFIQIDLFQYVFMSFVILFAIGFIRYAIFGRKVNL